MGTDHDARRKVLRLLPGVRRAPGQPSPGGVFDTRRDVRDLMIRG